MVISYKLSYIHVLVYNTQYIIIITKNPENTKQKTAII